MYLEFYRLREFPFSNVCEERYFYESPRHAEALARMLFTVRERRGLVLVTGEIGSGKTFLSRVLASRLGPFCKTLMVRYPSDTAKQIIRSVSQSLGLPASADVDKLTLVDALEKHLLMLRERGQPVALVFDEGQCLNDDALEEIRLLWNMEATGQRLVQIVLMGHPELRDRLQKPAMQALAQRVAMSYHLGPLTQMETTAYVLHRRKVAKAEGCRLQFTPNAMAEIYRASKGIPRVINVVCDAALLVGYARGKPLINSGRVAQAVSDSGPAVAKAMLAASEQSAANSRSSPAA